MSQSAEDKRVYKGYWWEPGNPERRWFGELTLSASSFPEIELYAEPAIDNHPTKVEVMVGGNGRDSFTLFDLESSNSHWSMGAGAYNSRTLMVQGIVFQGVKVFTSEVGISDLRLRFFNHRNMLLDVSKRWQVKHKVRYPTRRYRREFHSTKAEISYQDNVFNIYYGLSLSRRETYGTISTIYHPIFSISASSDNTPAFSIYDKLQTRLQRYLSILAGQLVYFDEFKALLATQPRIWVQLHNTGSLESSRSWIWRRTTLRNRVSIIFENTPHILQNWVDLYDKLENVINLFFITLEYGLDNESEYAILCQAVEGFHRIVFKGDLIAPETYAPDIYEALKKSVKQTQAVTGEPFKLIKEIHLFKNQVRVSDNIRAKATISFKLLYQLDRIEACIR